MVGNRKIIKSIGIVSIILGCYDIVFFYLIFNITHNITLISRSDTLQTDFINAVTTLFVFIACAFIPLMLYVIGGILTYRLREGGRKLLIGASCLTLFSFLINDAQVIEEIKEHPVGNLISYFLLILAALIIILFLTNAKVKEMFIEKISMPKKPKGIVHKTKDLLVETNIIRESKKGYLPAWSVAGTFILPIFCVFLSVNFKNIIFAWLVIPCMIVMPLLGVLYANKHGEN